MHKQIVRWLPLALLALLIVHFGATAIYLTPANPVKLRLLPAIQSYIEPLFTQKWELFAPDPLVDTRLLLLSCRLPSPGGGDVDTPWSDMTTPLLETSYHHRFSFANRIYRAQHASVQLIYQANDPLVDRILALKDDSPDFHALTSELGHERLAQMARGKRLLVRTASAECDRLYGVGRTHAVRVRMVQVKAPPFSQRQLPNDAGETKYVDFDWGAYERLPSL